MAISNKFMRRRGERLRREGEAQAAEQQRFQEAAARTVREFIDLRRFGRLADVYLLLTVRRFEERAQ
jgi:hypothetical protein